MIFLTVGTQLPFDRLVEALDLIQPEINMEIVGQVGRGTYDAVNIETFESLDPELFNLYIRKSELIISHAGMGSIISSLKLGKRIIVVPRLLKYNEHRNNHQIDTCEEVSKFNGVFVCYDLERISSVIFEALSNNEPKPIGDYADKEIINKLRFDIESLAAS